MSKLRLLFIKEAQAAYISHLDLMRTFQRCFPRTELEIKHTQGYILIPSSPLCCL